MKMIFFQVLEEDFIPSHDYDPDYADIGDDQHEFNGNEEHVHEEQPNEEHHNRENTRTRKKPSWHQDYVMHCSDEETPTTKTYSSPHFPPTYPYMQSALLTECHKSFLADVTKIKEPSSYAEASQNTEWVKAMQTELDALERNDTWIIMPYQQIRNL